MNGGYAGLRHNHVRSAIHCSRSRSCSGGSPRGGYGQLFESSRKGRIRRLLDVVVVVEGEFGRRDRRVRRGSHVVCGALLLLILRLAVRAVAQETRRRSRIISRIIFGCHAIPGSVSMAESAIRPERDARVVK
jgi:hypothetical protein